MPTAAFATLGCKVNQYETQRILDDFESTGFGITEFNKPADVYVINTCSVTQAAERKSRSIIRRLARQNPDAIVVMTGCYGEMALIKGESLPEVSLHIPNQHKLQTLNRVLERYPALQEATRLQPCAAKSDVQRRTRATIKVQDGCNVYCTFCSIPFTRKHMLSRSMQDVLDEVAQKAAHGYKEIVITGVLVGAYGQDAFESIPAKLLPRADMRLRSQQISLSSSSQEVELADLLVAIAHVPGIERVRLSSIEPTQVTDRLLQAFAAEPKLCPHLHIPLQSGDSGVLQRMNRPYDQEFYLDRCREAYARIPNLAITSDIMVGFPGEDRAAFEQTLHVVHTVGYARAHLFRFSPRPNTPAETMKESVSDSEKLERFTELLAACKHTQQMYIKKYIGRTLDVLVEGKEKGHKPENAEGDTEQPEQNAEYVNRDAPEGSALLAGYTGNYIRVQFTGGSHLIGTIQRVTLIQPEDESAIGEIGSAYFGPLEAPPDAEFISLTPFSGALTGR
jgi:threonylcarbamoyladenosine tRNA methylthiotransferase MtaB